MRPNGPGGMKRRAFQSCELVHRDYVCREPETCGNNRLPYILYPLYLLHKLAKKLVSAIAHMSKGRNFRYAAKKALPGKALHGFPVG